MSRQRNKRSPRREGLSISCAAGGPCNMPVTVEIEQRRGRLLGHELRNPMISSEIQRRRKTARIEGCDGNGHWLRDTALGSCFFHLPPPLIPPLLLPQPTAPALLRCYLYLLPPRCPRPHFLPLAIEPFPHLAPALRRRSVVGG
ncbi:hypothetical protein MLD38_021015 [Melastoma candidum]|uniref:Uncharacterized protein n=1 Tax=Melastoma candidum TaxID=119954 RepID=A0ACB9QFA0_9MYRT|nr:hypothetical protein MLD38_021015 [Melastoma candidum]